MHRQARATRARADLVRLWPIGKFPVLRDHAQERTVPESTIILEYIDRLRPEGPRLIPTAPDRALECRLRDRFYDTYIHLSVQKIVGDRLRPEGKRDALGVEQARAQMETARRSPSNVGQGGRPMAPRPFSWTFVLRRIDLSVQVGSKGSMRGMETKQSSMLCVMSSEARVPADHPLRSIKSRSRAFEQAAFAAAC